MTQSNRGRWFALCSAAVGLAVAITVRPGLAAGQAQRSPASLGDRVAAMRHHFLDVSLIHEAVIRGDLAGVLQPAATLARMQTPRGLPATAEPFVAAIREAGRAAASAPNLRTAAAATVTLLMQCAGCHQASGIFPGPVSERRPDVGGIVGHMLTHQRAADDLLQGLVIPSESRWQEGAAKLETLTLGAEDWPRDPKLTAEARQADVTVHALADQAREAATARARANVYVDLLTTCASCHSLHRRVWGPTGR
jgi:hypothetical protein